MNSRSCTLLIALSLAQVLACGDDDSTPSDQNTPDTGVITGKTDHDAAPADAGPASDAARPDSGMDRGMDASVHSDAGKKNDASTTDAGGNIGGDAGGALANSAACLQCEHDYCSAADITYSGQGVDLTTQCDVLTGNAADGPKKGTARAQLCKDILSCARRTGCAKAGPQACICGEQMNNAADCSAFAMSKGVQALPGACRAEYIAAAETTDYAKIQDLIQSLDLGTDEVTRSAVKSADVLLDCGRSFCIEECYGKICTATSSAMTMCGSDPLLDPRTCENGKCPPPPATYPAGPKDPFAADAGT
jgi:hypothetical protein